MKNRVTHVILSLTVVAAAISLAPSAQSQTVVYNNGTPAPYKGNFNYGNGEYGNEVGLASSEYISSFTFQFDLVNSSGGTTGTPTGTETVDLRFYANDGPNVAGYASPGTLLYDSGTATMNSVGMTSFSLGQNLTYAPDVTVPQFFTWTATFADVPVSESAGLALRSPPTVGVAYGDAWNNTGSGWALVVSSPANPGITLDFGAEAETVPEPESLWLFALAGGAGLRRLKWVGRKPGA